MVFASNRFVEINGSIQCTISAEPSMTMKLMSHGLEDHSYRFATTHRDTCRSELKTQGEIEAAVCEQISRLQHEYLGRGPKDIRAHLFEDLLVVRLQGVLTAPEQHLAKSLSAEK